MGLIVGTEKVFGGTTQRRVAVGIDPSRVALQISLLTPDGEKPRSKRVALGPGSSSDLTVPEGCDILWANILEKLNYYFLGVFYYKRSLINESTLAKS